MVSVKLPDRTGHDWQQSFSGEKPLNRHCVVSGDKWFFSFIRWVSAWTGQKNIPDPRSDKIYVTLSPHSESSLLDYYFPFLHHLFAAVCKIQPLQAQQQQKQKDSTPWRKKHVVSWFRSPIPSLWFSWNITKHQLSISSSIQALRKGWISLDCSVLSTWQNLLGWGIWKLKSEWRIADNIRTTEVKRKERISGGNYYFVSLLPQDT